MNEKEVNNNKNNEEHNIYRFRENDGFFERLKERENREGIVIYSSPETLRICMSIDLVEILYNAWQQQPFFGPGFEDFVGQYILNWDNNDANYRNHGISNEDFQEVRASLITTLAWDPTIWSTTIPQMFANVPRPEGIFIDYNINNAEIEIQRWNNQMC